jgi:hypothetical protein
MIRTFEQILEGLAALKPEDFDNFIPEELFALTDELMALPNPERGIPALFNLMERLSGSDLGCPGPIVHTLESMQGHYESELCESLRRKPTPLSVWMVNRILNACRNPEERNAYLAVLESAAEHPEASNEARNDALHFIELQRDGATD